MTDRELWDRIKGKPWAWPSLNFIYGGWWLGRTAIDRTVAEAVSRVACEDWLAQNASAFTIGSNSKQGALVPMLGKVEYTHEGEIDLWSRVEACDWLAAVLADAKGGD